MYLLPKIHKILDNAHGRPVILNCGTPTQDPLLAGLIIANHSFLDRL